MPVYIPGNNFAFALITNSPGLAGTSFTVPAGQGSRFKDPTATNPLTGSVYGSYPVFIRLNSTDPSIPSNTEEATLTDVSTDTLTVTRGSSPVNAVAGFQIFYGPDDRTGGWEFRGPVGIGNSGIPSNSTLLVAANKATSHITLDTAITVTGSVSDSGAIRGIASQADAGGASAVRGIESHALRQSLSSAAPTWGAEIGVHTEVDGPDNYSYNVGMFISSWSFGLPSAVRADTGVLVLGAVGWKYGFMYRDTDLSTVLFSISQTGQVHHEAPINTNLQVLAQATGTGQAVFAASAGVGSPSNSFGTNNSGDFILSSDGVAAGVLKAVHVAAVANTLLLSKGSVIVHAGGALATNATDGFLYVPTCAGAPSGVPTANAGNVALVFDTTNNKLMVYDGGWIGVTLS